MNDDQKAHEDEEALHDEDEGPAPFDEDPPVAPDRREVGNSKATFFMPSDTEAEDQDEEEGAGGESGPSRG